MEPARRAAARSSARTGHRHRVTPVPARGSIGLDDDRRGRTTTAGRRPNHVADPDPVVSAILAAGARKLAGRTDAAFAVGRASSCPMAPRSPAARLRGGSPRVLSPDTGIVSALSCEPRSSRSAGAPAAVAVRTSRQDRFSVPTRSSQVGGRAAAPFRGTAGCLGPDPR